MKNTAFPKLYKLLLAGSIEVIRQENYGNTIRVLAKESVHGDLILMVFCYNYYQEFWYYSHMSIYQDLQHLEYSNKHYDFKTQIHFGGKQ